MFPIFAAALIFQSSADVSEWPRQGYLMHCEADRFDISLAIIRASNATDWPTFDRLVSDEIDFTFVDGDAIWSPRNRWPQGAEPKSAKWQLFEGLSRKSLKRYERPIDSSACERIEIEEAGQIMSDASNVDVHFYDDDGDNARIYMIRFSYRGEILVNMEARTYFLRSGEI